MVVDRSRHKFFGGCLQLLGCFHRNIHDPSALAADIVVMWGCIIIEMIRAVAAGQLPDLAQALHAHLHHGVAGLAGGIGKDPAAAFATAPPGG